MGKLSPSQLLAVWEQAAPLPLVQRALLLLAAVWPEEGLASLAQESIGRRNARLLDLRAKTFGSALHSLAVCPACEDKLEFTFEISDLQQTEPSSAQPEFTLLIDSYQVVYRLPTSQDLLALPDPHDTPQTLLARCLIAFTQAEGPVEIEQIPFEVIVAVEHAMAHSDPLADIRLALQCPTCQHAWQAGFDIGHFFWQEIQAWALRLLRDVHLLASAYGWAESDILTMSNRRRQLYLKMIYG